MKLSIIIVNYNVRYFLEQCLLSVQAALQGIDGEIIVVDNVSKDGSCKMLKEVFPDVILIENTENVGFSKANNQGVAIAKGEYVLILNPDTLVVEDTFSKILYQANQLPNLGILGVKLVDGTGRFLPESKRGLPTPKVSFNKMFGISNPNKGKYYATHLTEDQSGNIEVLVGAFMLIERTKYNEVKGF
ncbi:MAG TPA: glycosyltransferase, partial [Lutibacter sp.]|nr:glycosyltransferase [Lutibacter sp.]